MVCLHPIRGRFSDLLCRTWLVLAIAPGLAGAQPAPLAAPKDAAEMNQARLAAMKAMAARYELASLVDGAGEGRRELERTPDPVQRWTNPIRGQLDGCLYLWTLAGRPQAALTIYPTLDGAAWNHEFQSLAGTPLVARLDGEEVWTPDQPGVEFKLVPDAPPPASATARRLTQMRSMARGFAATIDVRGDKTALRLLPAPIYRYGQEGGDPLDGAAFVFAQATDPELLLLLEARPVEGEARWHYGLARLTLWPTSATYESAPIWSVEKWIRATSHPKQTYLDRVRREE
jgi:hypothetical protein